MIMILIIATIMGVIGALLGKPKGRLVEGILLGFFLGIVGLIILGVLKPKVSVMS